MKYIFRFFATLSLLFLFHSCTTETVELPENNTVEDSEVLPDDDANEEGPTEDVNTDSASILSLSILKRFEEGSLVRLDSTRYVNGKPSQTTRYDDLNALINTTDWFYLSNGLFDSLQTKLPDGTLTLQEKVLYDDEKRLVKWTFLENDNGRTFRSEEFFSYETENTIATITDPDSGGLESTLELDDGGIIFKETSDGIVKQIAWDTDYNPIQLTEENTTTTFDLLSERLKKPFFSNQWVTIFGSKNNFILWSNRFSFSIPEFSFGNRYITAQDDGNFRYTYQYDFDNQGFPVKKTTLLNGTLSSETEYFYE